MWSDLSEIPFATALGHCTARRYGQGRNLDGSFLCMGRTCHIAGSNVISSPRWFLSAASWRFAQEWVPREGTAGSAGAPSPSSPRFLLPCARSLWDERCSVLEVQGDSGRAGGGAGGDMRGAFLGDLAPREHMCGCCAPIARWIVFFPTCQLWFL